MKRVSIKDVAKEAGVSASTVSYVLNSTPTETISPETKKRVMEAVSKLGYVPNLNARSLSSRRSNLIGVLIPQTEPGKELMFSNPFYGELLSSIEYTARQHGYHLLVSGTKEDQDYLSIAQNRGVDGVIIVGTYPGENLNALKTLGVPIVLVDSYVKDDFFHTIGIEDKEGARMATRYLIEKGHRSIAFVSGSIRENGVNIKRYQGYCDAMREAGLAVNEQAVYSGTVDYEYGMDAAREFLARGRKQTAAFVTADVITMGLIKGLQQNHIRIPDLYKFESAMEAAQETWAFSAEMSGMMMPLRLVCFMTMATMQHRMTMRLTMTRPLRTMAPVVSSWSGMNTSAKVESVSSSSS